MKSQHEQDDVLIKQLEHDATSWRDDVSPDLGARIHEALTHPVRLDARAYDELMVAPEPENGIASKRFGAGLIAGPIAAVLLGALTLFVLIKLAGGPNPVDNSNNVATGENTSEISGTEVAVNEETGSRWRNFFESIGDEAKRISAQALQDESTAMRADLSSFAGSFRDSLPSLPPMGE